MRIPFLSGEVHVNYKIYSIETIEKQEPPRRVNYVGSNSYSMPFHIAFS